MQELRRIDPDRGNRRLLVFLLIGMGLLVASYFLIGPRPASRVSLRGGPDSYHAVLGLLVVVFGGLAGCWTLTRDLLAGWRVRIGRVEASTANPRRGDSIDFQVGVSGLMATRVRQVEVELRCEEEFFAGGGTNRRTAFQQMNSFLQGASLVPGATQVLRGSVCVPAEGRPTDQKFSWSLRVHVDLPWWPDLWAEFELNVV